MKMLEAFLDWKCFSMYGPGCSVMAKMNTQREGPNASKGDLGPKNSHRSLFCAVWTDQVSFSIAESLLRLVIQEHGFDINRSAAFCETLLDFIVGHCSYS